MGLVFVPHARVRCISRHSSAPKALLCMHAHVCCVFQVSPKHPRAAEIFCQQAEHAPLPTCRVECSNSKTRFHCYCCCLCQHTCSWLWRPCGIAEDQGRLACAVINVASALKVAAVEETTSVLTWYSLVSVPQPDPGKDQPKLFISREDIQTVWGLQGHSRHASW